MSKRKPPTYAHRKPLPLESITPLRGEFIAGLDNDRRKQLELLTHQLAFFANRLHNTINDHDLTKRPTLPYPPAKDLTILVKLACELLDLHEEVRFTAESRPTT